MRGGVYRLEGVERRHGERLALSIDSLHVRHGDILGLAGPNGSGKSTLLRILALLDAPTKGRLWFQGREIAVPSSADRRRVSLLLQEPYLLKKSVFENVAYGLRVRGENHDAPARVGQALEWVGLDPANFAPRAWHKLSGGEAQRVALAARLVLKPKVLLMDEPTASLDASSGVLIKEAALRARREWGTTLVIASHDLLWLYAVSDQVLNLHQGRLAGAEPISLIPGPWEHAPDGGQWRTILGDGRQVLAQAPESPDDGKQRLAVIRPGDIRLHAERPRGTEGANLLKGEVIHASLERSSGQVLIQVSVDRLSFLVRLNDHAHGGMNLLPGIQLWISFPAQAVNWL